MVALWRAGGTTGSASEREPDRAANECADAGGDSYRRERMPSDLEGGGVGAILQGIASGRDRSPSVPHVFVNRGSDGLRIFTRGFGHGLRKACHHTPPSISTNAAFGCAKAMPC